MRGLIMTAASAFLGTSGAMAAAVSIIVLDPSGRWDHLLNPPAPPPAPIVVSCPVPVLPTPVPPPPPAHEGADRAMRDFMGRGSAPTSGGKRY